MHYYKIFLEKYKHLYQIVSNKKDNYINFIIYNKDAYFLSIGLFCPLIVFGYKLYLGENYTIFPPLFGVIALQRLLENLSICLLLPYTLFFFICNKKIAFYDKIYKKIDFIFQVLGFFYKVMFLLCGNLLISCIFIVGFYLLYLYCIYFENSIHYCKIIIIPPTLSLALFLDQSDKDSYLLKKYPTFLLIREKLKETHYRNNIESISQFCMIPLLILLKMNFDVLASVTKMNNDVYDNIKYTEKKIINLNDSGIKEGFEKLKNKKEIIFQSHFKNVFFYKASIYVYGPLKKPQSFEEICNEIKNFSTNL